MVMDNFSTTPTVKALKQYLHKAVLNVESLIYKT